MRKEVFEGKKHKETNKQKAWYKKNEKAALKKDEINYEEGCVLGDKRQRHTLKSLFTEKQN